MTEGLKPCPFCGSKAVIGEHENPPSLAWYGYFPEYYYSMGCNGEHCVSMSGFWTPELAAEHWNRRTL